MGSTGSEDAYKVALITGGASGMGLAVATALANRTGWHVHLLDLNPSRGEEAAAGLGKGAHFHKVNVTSYSELSSAFAEVFRSEGRLDFVFANAGVVERYDFYASHDTGKDPPPEPDQLTTDVCLKAVISTSYLAHHYFRQSPDKGKGASLVMTASCGAFYPSEFSPIYTAAKHGVVGFMRAIAKKYYNDGIRANAICPGTVRTNLLSETEWSQFPPEYFTPIEAIVDTVVKLVDGKDMVDANGTKAPADQLWGRAVELSGENIYFRQQPDFCDDAMRKVMGATEMDNRMGANTA